MVPVDRKERHAELGRDVIEVVVGQIAASEDQINAADARAE